MYKERGASEKANKIFVDGTFKSCSKRFYQLFSLFIKNGNFYVPIVFTLFSNKNTESYMLAFKNIAEYIKVNTVFADFERGKIHN